MEIERKYLIPEIPNNLHITKTRELEQGYLCTSPVVRLILAEVEFADEDEANQFTPPEWFGEDVTFSSRYHNSNLSRL